MATANVIYDAPAESFNYMLYPEQHANTQRYIQNQFQNISNTLTDIGRNFIETSKDLLAKINDSEAIRTAKAALRMAKGITRPNIVMELNTLEDIRSAQPVMQRYIMAEPTLRALYNEQRCNGYDESYYNMFPGDIGKDHYDYKMVMSGVIEDIVDENGDDSWKVNTYAFDLLDSDKELSKDCKLDILHTWDVVKMAIAALEDPTCIYGSKL